MNITADGNYDLQRATPGKEHIFSVTGNFGGGTLSLLFVEGANSGAIRDANGPIALKSAGATVFPVPHPGFIRVTLFGSSGANIDFHLIPKVD